MAKQTCPVRQTVVWLSERILSGILTDPKGRRISEQLLELIEEIAEGAAGPQHLDAIDELIESYFFPESPKVNQDTGQEVKRLVSEHREVFHNHIVSRNCPSHDCGKLAPF
jgi:hypothetical protein